MSDGSKGELQTQLSDRGDGPREPGAFRITVVGGADAGKTITVDANSPSSVLVGKSAACDLVLGDMRVSRRHASLDIAEDWMRLQDLRSTNGTTVNGVLVLEALLRGGETIGVGGTAILVERQTAEPSRLNNLVGFGRVIGASSAMRRLYPLCEGLASSDLPIVIEGETGTGKELLAEVIHEGSRRSSQPFIVCDCSAVAPALLESALFGEEGATPTRGAFEAAHQGTLVIDEITALAPALQRKLLRAVERGEICRLGGTDNWQRVDVRVIATTSRDLEKEVEAGRFLEDLFFRLAVGRVDLPPLRRRQSDISLLAECFWKRLSDRDYPLPHDFLRRYDGYPWPGNVRELHNAVALRLALGDADSDGDKPLDPDGAPTDGFRWVLEQDLPFTSARDLVEREFVRTYVERVLEQHKGNVSRAAAASGVARRYFQILRAGKR
jgi:DNA-binding NtrC family response regulator